MSNPLRFALSVLAMFAAGCARSPSNAFAPAGDGGAAEGGVFGGDAGPSHPAAGEVYGHSANTLYRVDAITHEVRTIGFFEGCTYVADIALDQDSNLYASTGTALYLIETATAHCTHIADGTFPNSLSFVPAGTVDDGFETLVGYQGADYVKIDRATGAVTKVGSLGGGFVSSGDIVSAKGGATFLTVKGPSCADCLVEVDPKTGAMTKNWGPIGYADVFGIAFWGGVVYGFSNGGDLFQVTFDGNALKTLDIPIPDKAPDLHFWGAGSTTSAPVTPVK